MVGAGLRRAGRGRSPPGQELEEVGVLGEAEQARQHGVDAEQAARHEVVAALGAAAAAGQAQVVAADGVARGSARPGCRRAAAARCPGCPAPPPPGERRDRPAGAHQPRDRGSVVPRAPGRARPPRRRRRPAEERPEPRAPWSRRFVALWLHRLLHHHCIVGARLPAGGGRARIAGFVAAAGVRPGGKDPMTTRHSWAGAALLAVAAVACQGKGGAPAGQGSRRAQDRRREDALRPGLDPGQEPCAPFKLTAAELAVIKQGLADAATGKKPRSTSRPTAPRSRPSRRPGRAKAARGREGQGQGLRRERRPRSRAP